MDSEGGNNPNSPRIDNQPTMQPGGVVSPQPMSPTVAPAQNANDTIPQSSGMPTAPTLEYPADPTGTQQSMQPSPEQMFPHDQSSPVGGSRQSIVLPQSSGSPRKSSKMIIMIAAALIVAGILLAAGYFIGLTAGKSQGRAQADAEYQRQQAEAQQQAAEGEQSNTGDAELKIGDLEEPKYIDETVKGEVGKQVSTSDGLVLKVTNIERGFEPDGKNYKLDDTKELVKVNFLMGNITKDKAKDISSFSFRLENADGAQLVPENIESYEDKFDTVKLDPGAQTKGSIVYAVKKGEKPLKFVREQRYRISGENREVTSKIVITVAK